MASHVYPLAKQSFISGGIDLTSSNVKIVLLTSAYTYSATHQFLTDLTGSIVTSGNLASKTVVNGVFDAADVTFTAVTTGSTVASLVGYKDTGTGSTSPLIWINDGFSLVTNGGDIQVQFDNGANKIFAL
jgi:hypothetical protein